MWLGVFLFLLGMILFRKVRFGREVLDISDQYSYEIYLVHQFFILGPMSLMTVTKLTFLNILIIYGCIITVAFALKNIEIFFNT